ncbi:helix-turn-helix transcriptional regulator [Paenarthrobacter sp. AT5]|uniref:helix-turn-helix transcriptional regulator n=1 Tax=Paenarthrobacter TaxID=1742992 RepID=UPI001A9966BD|nr:MULTISPECIES: helix-turn-helix transcriptional regulator [Paenarthrobacter]QSZ53064.1 hypothetical protein AYX19_08685 [Paenarthrobacter ureafaciens]WOC60119.1 helix-turn-helix transcriptional regulator [Paenarthrobacter sp. AT5]
MEWTVTKVIGHNVRKRRDELGITAAALGERVGQALGKSWPRQTVYLMESGERAMIATEIAVLAELLNVPVVALFAPPPEPDSVIAGTLTISTETLAISSADEDERLTEIAKSLRAIDNSRKALNTTLTEQYVLIENAKNALLGKPRVQAPEGESVTDTFFGLSIMGAEKHYDSGRKLRDLAEIEEEDSGEGN